MAVCCLFFVRVAFTVPSPPHCSYIATHTTLRRNTLTRVEDVPVLAALVGVVARALDGEPLVGAERVGQVVGDRLAVAHDKQQLAVCDGAIMVVAVVGGGGGVVVGGGGSEPQRETRRGKGGLAKG